MVSRNRGQLSTIDRMLCRAWLRNWVNRGDAGLQSTERNSRAEITELSQGHDRRHLGREAFSDRAAIPGRSRTRGDIAPEKASNRGCRDLTLGSCSANYRFLGARSSTG